MSNVSSKANIFGLPSRPNFSGDGGGSLVAGRYSLVAGRGSRVSAPWCADQGTPDWGDLTY
jgi:hypothetical protein